MSYTEQLLKDIEPQKQELLQHPIYTSVDDIDALRNFTTHHVFAVWDFMSLLKALQQKLTCVSTPWVPAGDANTRYLINEIVLGEESDIDEHGNRGSHYELYIDAMKEMGAPTDMVDGFITKVVAGRDIKEVIAEAEVPSSIKEFLSYTFDVVNNAPAHVIAAVFTFGREDLIPDMFLKFVEQLSKEHPQELAKFKYYLERHIELDGDHHSHLALQMLEQLCKDDAAKWKEATDAAIKSLQMRAILWDGVLQYA